MTVSIFFFSLDLVQICGIKGLGLSQEFSLRQGTPGQVFIPATLHEGTSILNLQKKY